MGVQKLFSENFSLSLYNGDQNTTPIDQPSGQCRALLNGNPNSVDAWMDLFISGGSSVTFVKAYIRQFKTFGIATNHGNTSVCLQMTRFRFRKDVSFSEFSNVESILNANSAIDVDSSYLAPVTRSYNAQQLLIFGKTKYKILRQGEMCKFRVNRKYKGGIPVTRETWGDVGYLGRRGMTSGIIFKVHPPGVTYRDITSVADAGGYPAGWNVNIVFNSTTTGYTVGQDGDNVAGSSFGPWITPGIGDSRGLNNQNDRDNGNFLPSTTVP